MRRKRFDSFELALGIPVSLCVLAWLVSSLTDLNHPPGMRYAKLFCMCVAAMFGVIEFRKPGCGYLALFFLLPHTAHLNSLIVELLPLHGSLSDTWFGAPMATVVFGQWLRMGWSVPVGEIPAKHTSCATAFRSGLIGFLLAWMLSAAVNWFALSSPPLYWTVVDPDWRGIWTQSPFSKLYTVIFTIVVLPYVIGALLSIKELRNIPKESKEKLWNAIVYICALNGCLVATQVIAQIIFGFEFSFNQTPAAGPFANRNTTAPFLVFLAIPCLAPNERGKSIILSLSGIVMLLAAVMAGSRNGYLMVFATVLMLIFRLRSDFIRKYLIAGLVVSLVIIFAVPLPDYSTVDNPALRRVLYSLDSLQRRRGSIVMDAREEVFQGAYRMITRSPLVGTGPFTYGMANAGSRSRLILTGIRGRFMIDRLEDSKGYFLKVRPTELSKTADATALQLECFKEKRYARHGETITITGEAAAEGTDAFIFIQTRLPDGKWVRKSEKLSAREAVTVALTIEESSDQVLWSCGYYFEPKSLNDSICIRSISALDQELSYWRGPTSIDVEKFPQSGDSGTIHLAAHSVPLNLWAEIGLVGALAWIFVWVCLPGFLVLTRKGGTWTWMLLICGIGNVFDTACVTTSLAIIGFGLVALACDESEENSLKIQ